MLELDEQGYDKNNFNIKGIHRITNTRFDENGYDYKGYNKKGLNEYGYDRDGNKKSSSGQKIIHAFNQKPTKENENQFIYQNANARGFFQNGFNRYTKTTYDRRRFLMDGTHIKTGLMYNEYGHDAYGYNLEGFDEYGFNKFGVNEYTKTKYDLDGFDVNGYNSRGFNNKTKKHIKTNTNYDEYGFNINGLWKGRNKYSSDTGLDVDGYDKLGFDVYGIDKVGNNKLGKKDERICLVEELFYSGKSMEEFARKKEISYENLELKLGGISYCLVVKDMICEIKKRELIYVAKKQEKLERLEKILTAVKDKEK